MNMLVKSYYELKPLIPRHVQIVLHQWYTQRKRSYCKNWPIDIHAADIRPPWSQWPGNKRFALVLTHDVETAEGVAKCPLLMQMEEQLGFRSSFNFVPEKYNTPDNLLKKIKANGFEIGVHGLLHDGKLYKSRQIFMERAQRINRYLEQWQAVGFRSPSMHHNLSWLHNLNIAYDASTFDTDPFEPDSSGTCRIFPFWVHRGTNTDEGYAELPYTLVQDSTLFLFLQESTIDIWIEKLDWLVQKGGMALVNVHPDYMNFTSDKQLTSEYPSTLYQQFLEYIKTRHAGMYWHALPQEMAKFTFMKYKCNHAQEVTT